MKLDTPLTIAQSLRHFLVGFGGGAAALMLVSSASEALQDDRPVAVTVEAAKVQDGAKAVQLCLWNSRQSFPVGSAASRRWAMPI